MQGTADASYLTSCETLTFGYLSSMSCTKYIPYQRSVGLEYEGGSRTIFANHQSTFMYCAEILGCFTAYFPVGHLLIELELA